MHSGRGFWRAIWRRLSVVPFVAGIKKKAKVEGLLNTNLYDFYRLMDSSSNLSTLLSSFSSLTKELENLLLTATCTLQVRVEGKSIEIIDIASS